jgi:hypothetical protein
MIPLGDEVPISKVLLGNVSVKTQIVSSVRALLSVASNGSY